VKRRPIELAVDFLVGDASSEVEGEFVVLSRDVENEVEGTEYVAVRATGGEGGWRVFRVRKGLEGVEGRKIVVCAGEEVRKAFVGRVLVQSVTPAPLESVVLKVSEQDYDLVSEDHEAFHRLKDQGTVFRAGKTITVTEGVQLEVTLCEPVRQGILGEDTEIILVTDHDLQNGLVNGGLLGTPFSTASQNDSTSDLDISQFLSLPSSEDDFDNETTLAENSILLPPEDDPNTRGIPLRVSVLELPVDKFSLDPRPAESEDDEFRVYAHMRDIARLGIFSGDWVFPSSSSI
jgi:peroxin-6